MLVQYVPLSSSRTLTQFLQGKGVQIFAKKVEPLLKAAHTITDITCAYLGTPLSLLAAAGARRAILTAQLPDTTHAQHALEICRELPLGKYDAVVAVSGDGLIHEVLNGFAQHQDPIRALRIPIAPIPTGSGNGLSLNLLGLEVGLAPRLHHTHWGSLTSHHRRVSMSPPRH